MLSQLPKLINNTSTIIILRNRGVGVDVNRTKLSIFERGGCLGRRNGHLSGVRFGPGDVLTPQSPYTFSIRLSFLKRAV